MTAPARQPRPSKPLPFWPRRLDVEAAARYVGLSATTFRAGVLAGRWPAPKREGKRVLWDIRALDAVIDADSGLAPPTAPAGAAEPDTWGDL